MNYECRVKMKLEHNSFHRGEMNYVYSVKSTILDF